MANALFIGELSDADRAIERLRLAHGRLAVRFPADHEVLVSFTKAQDATSEALRAASHVPGGKGTAGAVRPANGQLIAATDEFIRAAVKTVGARLDG